MAKDTKYALGVDLGGTSIKLGIVSEKGKIVKKASLESNADKGPKDVVKQIVKGIEKLLANSKYKIEGIGIGAPGVVSLEKGTVENPPNFPGWGKIHLGERVKKKTGYNVFVENDANVAAVGEMIFGAGKKLDSFIMVTLGTGVGGGVILNRQLFRGEYGGAGELGHISIDYDGAKCNCGSIGCVEAYAGNNYLIQRVVNKMDEYRDTLILKLVNDDISHLTPKTIFDAAELEDEYALQIIDDLGDYIGFALSSAANLLDVSKFIIGGGVAGFGEKLFVSIEDTMKQRTLKSLQPRIKIIPAKLKNNAGIKGASSLVFYKKN